MSTQPIAAYSFLPWARQGLGIYIREGDQDATVKVRGSLDVSLQITGERISGGTATEPVPRTVQLYGPGDIIGVDAKVIVRIEPRHWITNFETNYMPFVEFYEEDFPWRYTPAKPSPDGRRLRPWLALVVLEEGEFDDKSTNILGRPLPFIEVADADQKFPPADQLWAWAHVHISGGLGVDPNDTAALAARLDQTVRTNRDLAYSRLLCPRILKENTGYHAFVIPSFETGRLAGLGKDLDGVPFATHSAWADYSGREDATLFPYYHRWYFRTGTVGDFEYLVRLLRPRTVDPRVGRRDMDVQQPGANLPGIPELGGVLRLGGALRPPLATLSDDDLAEYNRFEEWGEPYPHPFQTALAALVNLAADYAEQSADQANAASGLGPAVEDDEDPLIVPPIYGRWHSQTQRLVPAEGDPEQKKWVQELNLDPRHRVVAGFGTEVVQKNQENYMEAAWQQVGKVLEGNQKIRYGQMAKLTSQVWHTRELAMLQQRAPERFMAVVAPVQRRVLADGLTIHHQVQKSTLPPAVMSKTIRQALRPRGRVTQLVGFDAQRSPVNLLERVNRGEVSAAPPKVVAPNLPIGDRLADDLRPRDLPRPLLELLERYPWLRFLPLILALLITVLLFAISPALAIVAGAALIAGALWLYRRLDAILSSARAAQALDPETRTPASVDRLPASPDFRIGTPGQDPAPTIGTTDSAEAARFKESLRNLYTVDAVERAIEIPVRRPLELRVIARATIENLQPERTIPPRVLGSIFIPPRIREQLIESFGEVMVYPEIDLPMYEPLKEISSELFLPNIQLIENNSITLIETNQKFIESYMVGLNHEFARELLWREYPTDQRGSYFRQFWDVRGFLAEASADPEALRERLRDIPELHRWPKDSALGDHDHREAQGDKEEELVLVIRGELLKKYPTAVIYAHRAAWERTSDNQIDKTRPRKLTPLTLAQEVNPPRDLVKSPLYEAKVDPDIYFFGFDLTGEKARGGQIVNGEEDPGWFFVIKERPGEPRFGLDLPQAAPQATVYTWNDLAWTDVLNTYTAGAFLRVGERTVTLMDPGSASDAKQQYDEDSRFRWQADTHAAELAYILYQLPVLMAVHAAEMLKRPE
jgi:HAMP domain-containing protein